MQVILDNFTLIEYNHHDDTHFDVINKLNHDDSSKKYLGDLFYTIERVELRKEDNFNNGNYIVFYDNNPVGYLNLSYKEDDYYLTYAILKEFRNKHLASLLLKEFTEYAFDKLKINKLVLTIEYDNIGSQKVAITNNYQQDDLKHYSKSR